MIRINLFVYKAILYKKSLENKLIKLKHHHNGSVASEERYSKLVQDTSNGRGAAFPECSRGLGAETGWKGFLLMMSMY